MVNTPWDRAKTGTEHGEQSALFQWCNLAAKFGVEAANDPKSYSVKGYALGNYGIAEPGWHSGEIVAAQLGPNAVPALGRLYAIHNQGHGDRIRGNRARAEGVKTGVPDTHLPIPRLASDLDHETFGPLVVPYRDGGYGFGVVCGLYIELKVREVTKPGVRKAEVVVRRAGTTSDQQDDWINFLRGAGHAVAVCYGWEEARDVLLAYLGLR